MPRSTRPPTALPEQSEGPDSAVVLGKTALGLRRALGPVAWFVLEELMLCATEDNGQRVAHVSARVLAGRLGLDKDTAARAVARLCAAGVVVRSTQRRANAGRFGSGALELLLPAGLSMHRCPSMPDTMATPRTVRVARQRGSPRPTEDVQLSLLEATSQP